MTGFYLKIIALITMVLDHIKFAIPFTNGFITKYFGRIAFPIFAFLITEGYFHTKSRKNYIIRLLTFAIISQIPFMLFRTLVADKLLLNILFTFLFAILGLAIFEYFKEREEINKIFRNIIILLSFFSIATIGEIINVDYGWFGIVTVWIFFLFKKSKWLTLFIYILNVLIYYCSIYYPYLNQLNLISVLFTIVPSIIILFYNGKEGKKIKYLFYIFYPLHMLIFYLINLLIK